MTIIVAEVAAAGFTVWIAAIDVNTMLCGAVGETGLLGLDEIRHHV